MDEFRSACDALYCIPEGTRQLAGSRNASAVPTTCAAGRGCKSCAGKLFGQRGCRIDFMAIHPYGCTLDRLQEYVDETSQMFGLPIWLTEFGCWPSLCGHPASDCDASVWDAQTERVTITYSQMARKMRDFLAYLDDNPNVRRYTWWTQRANATEIADGNYAFQMLDTGPDYNSNGTYWNYNMTPVGRVYHTFDMNGSSTARTSAPAPQGALSGLPGLGPQGEPGSPVEAGAASGGGDGSWIQNMLGLASPPPAVSYASAPLEGGPAWRAWMPAALAALAVIAAGL